MTLNLQVTHRKLSLGSRDSVTGWYAKEFTEQPRNIEMLIIPRSASSLARIAGTYVRLDALGLTCDGVEEGDEVKTDAGVYYEVKATREHFISNSFSHREVDLTLLPLHSLSWSPSAPTVEDARYRTKVYWDTYISDSNLHHYRWLVCYSNPPYPLTKVFIEKRREIVFTLDGPNSTPMLDYDHTPRGYEEHVPTHIVTFDTELNHLAEAELRRIVESYPTGSQRSLERRGTVEHHLGSTTLYDTTFMLNYFRDTT